MQALPAGRRDGARSRRARPRCRARSKASPGVSIAAVNGPSSVVVSGDEAAVDALVELWRERGRRVRRLRVSHAFHSARMDPVLDELGEVAADLEHRAPQVAWVGALTGELVTRAGARLLAGPGPRRRSGSPTPSRRWPARASQCSSRSARTGRCPRWARPRSPVPAKPRRTPSSSRSAARTADASASVLTALARAHVHGVRRRLGRGPAARRRVDLPTYAFQHQRFWPQRLARRRGALGRRSADAVRRPRPGSGPRSRAGRPGRPGRCARASTASARSARCCRCWRRGGGASGTSRRPPDGATGSPGRRSPNPAPARLTRHLAGRRRTGRTPSRPRSVRQGTGCRGARRPSSSPDRPADGRTARPSPARIGEALARRGRRVSGVLSLLALDERRWPDGPRCTAGLAGDAGPGPGARRRRRRRAAVGGDPRRRRGRPGRTC